MTFNQITVGLAGVGKLIAPASQIVRAGDSSVLVLNTSTNVTVYLTENNAYTSGDAGTQAVSALGPQQSVVFSGEIDVFGVAPSGQSATLNLYPSATNFTNFTAVTSVFTLSFAFPVSVPITPVSAVDVSLFSAIDISVEGFCSSQNTAGAPLTQTLTLQWFDAGILVYEEVWSYLIGSAAGSTNPALGSFPVRGTTLTVVVSQNASATVASTLQNLTVIGTQRNVPYSTMRQDSGGNMGLITGVTHTGVPTDITIGSPGFDNHLATITGFSPGAGQPFIFPLPLVAGPAFLQSEVSTAVAANNPCLINLSYATSHNILMGAAQEGQVWQAHNVVNELDQVTIDLPRAPCALTVNSSATSSFYFTLIARNGY